MSNMSYCRFENTLTDINECLDALEERNISSDSERRKAKKMLEAICTFLLDAEIIEDYKSDRINEIIEQCKEEKEDEE